MVTDSRSCTGLAHSFPHLPAAIVVLLVGMAASACGSPTQPLRTPAKLTFTVQPSRATAGMVITPAMQVAIQDGYGNTVTSATSAVTVAIGANPGGGTLSGPQTVNAVNGVASFAGLSIDKAGSGYMLMGSSGPLTSATSVSFTVTPATATTLVFTVQPSTTAAGHTSTPAVQVTIEDALGNTVTTSTSTITLAIGTNPASGTLSGTTAVATANGVGTFSNWSIDTPGTGYTLTASASGLARATSTSFNVTGFTSVSAGSAYTCGVTSAGAAYCWGYDGYGQLGRGSLINSSTPVAVSGGLPFTVISAGCEHSCGVTTGGAAYCWGYNSSGELGNGSPTDSSTPVAVSGGLTFAAISAGNFYTCGVTTAGAAYCWGNSYFSQLGNGSTTYSSTPVAVSGGLTFAVVSAGYDHSCGVTTDGAAYCWGGNGSGELGNGSNTHSATPVPGAYPLTWAAAVRRSL